MMHVNVAEWNSCGRGCEPSLLGVDAFVVFVPLPHFSESKSNTFLAQYTLHYSTHIVKKLNYIFTKYILRHMEAQVDSVKENIKEVWFNNNAGA